MAQIQGSNDSQVFTLNKFLGLNENEDGDTKLKLGEAAEMINWKVTNTASLQTRPGTKVLSYNDGNDFVKFFSKIYGMWFGNIKGFEHFIVAADGHVWDVDISGSSAPADIGECAPDTTTFFGYSGIVYLLNGHQYLKWDGTGTFQNVEGYVPLILVAANHLGAGTELEQINVLSGKRKIRYTTDGTSTQYNFPEKPIVAVHSVKIDTEETSDYTVDLDGGFITFPTAPEQGVNNMDVVYEVDNEYASTVSNMRYYEFYNGSNLNRVFLYGDGTNKCIYSGIDYDGNSTAEYFPAMNVIAAGEENTPITGMIRHFSRLICFKTHSTYSIAYSSMTLDDGRSTAGFYINPVNRSIGNIAPGQVNLITNNPLSLHGNSVYEWKANSYSGGNITLDERQAKKISDHVDNTLRYFDLEKTYCYDDNFGEEYYIVYNGEALVYNYGMGCWYKYTQFPVCCMVSINDELYLGCTDGTIRHMSKDYKFNDYGTGYRKEMEGIPSVEGCTVKVDKSIVSQKIQGDFVQDVIVYDGESAVWRHDGVGIYDLAAFGIEITDNDPENPVHFNDGDTITILDVNPKPIVAFWRSGSLSFGKEWRRKYSSDIWVTLLPENGAKIVVTARSDKKANYPEKLINYSLISFVRMTFEHFSFNTNRRSQVKHMKLKVKKYAFYQLCFEFNCSEIPEDEPSITSTATILGVNIQVRFSGNVK